MSADAAAKRLQVVEFDDDSTVGLGRWLVEALHTERALVERVLEQRHQTIISELEVQLRGAGCFQKAGPREKVRQEVQQEMSAVDVQDSVLWAVPQSTQVVPAAVVAEGTGTEEEPDREPAQGADRELAPDALGVTRQSSRKSVTHWRSALSFQNLWEESLPASERRNGLNTHHSFLFSGSVNFASPGFASTMNWAARLVTSRRFEIGFALLIVLNTFVSAMQVQYEGLQSDFEVDYTLLVTGGGRVLPADRAWPHAREAFYVLEMFFGVIFTMELALKMVSGHRAIWCCKWNLFDGIIITVWLLSSFFKVDLLMNPMILRVCRIIRLLRLLKLLKTIELLDSLHLLISSIKASMSVLIWSAVLLVFVMLMSSLVLNAQLVSYMRGGDGPLERRQDVYMYFGSFTRSMLTMFEITLGNWVPVCRLLLEHVHEGYALFFVVYKVVIGFGCVKVITAVFMHETFKVAGADNALMVIQRERTVKEHEDKMRALFQEADSSRDGYLNEQEFESVLNNPWVKTWLAAMELTVQDTSTLFKVLAQEDGRISPRELVNGVAKLKGPARSLDMVTILSSMDKDHKSAFAELRARVEDIDRRGQERDPKLLHANLEAMVSEIRSAVVEPWVLTTV